MLTNIDYVLPRTSPEQQGISSAGVLKLVEALDSQIHEVHSFMLLRHGSVVAEGWWGPYAANLPHMLYSLSKSFTSTAVGLAVNEGLFSLDDPVLPFFPDEAPAEVNEHLAAMQVRHLLSMSTGHHDDTMPPMIEKHMHNWVEGFFAIPVVHPPGTHFLYNTGASYLLGVIVQQRTGMSLTEYLRPRLFEPLGIKGARWEISPQGFETGGFGLSIKTEDIARFGQLYLQKGMWQGKRILPEGWVEAATSVQVSSGTDPNNDWAQGYGFQFWRCRHNAYRGDGAFGQYCIIMPEHDVVLVMTSGLGDMQQPMNLVWDILLPAISAEAIPEDAAAHQHLTEKLSSLNLPPLAGQASSPTAAQVSGKTYTFEPNGLNVKTMSLKFNETGCAIRINTGGYEETISCGHNAWQFGETMLFNQPWELEPAPIAVSGAWTDERFTAVIRFYHTPFFYTIDFLFAGDALTVESIVNVGFTPPEKVVMKGQAG